MIVPMTKYSFLLMSNEAGNFLEKLSALGMVDIKRSRKPVDDTSSSMLARADELKREISWIEKEDFSKDNEYASLTASLNEASKELKNVLPWEAFDPVAIAKIEECGYKVHFYCASNKKFDPDWENQYPLEIINNDGKTVHFVIISSESPQIKATEIPAPSESCIQVQKRIDSIQKRIDERAKELLDRKALVPEMKKQYENILGELDIHLAGVAAESAAEKHICIFTGFAPEEDELELRSQLDNMDVFYFADKAVTEDNPPVKLKNNAFSRQFEVFTGMYGMPAYNEFDPTVFLSIFYLLFFAICMGDAGYGLLLMLIGFLLKGKEGGLAKLYKLIIILGGGTFVVGLFMGTFFGVDLTSRAWVPYEAKERMITGEIGGYSAQMVIALAIGVIHICLAMITKAIWSVKKSGFLDSLSTIGWTLLIVGTVITAAFALVGYLSEDAAKLVIISIAAVSALGIFIFNKIGRNPLINIGSGLWDTYNMASGLMGDVLSYIRLYALGLSGGMLGSTFNLLAGMVKDGGIPVISIVGSLLILVLGHVLNLALSSLGAFVHPLRLNFVEFFKNSGYEGSGKQFSPLGKNNNQ